MHACVQQLLAVHGGGCRWCTYSADPTSKEAVAFMWNAARRFVHGSTRPGDLNQSIMVRHRCFVRHARPCVESGALRFLVATE